MRFRRPRIEVAIALLVGLTYFAMGAAVVNIGPTRGRIGFVFIFLSFFAFYHAWSAWRQIEGPIRFSLRTLLIAMTLVAIVLGAIVYAFR